MSDSSNSSNGGGNTRTPPKKQGSCAKYWSFTLNDFTKDDILRLQNWDSSIVPQLVFQDEIGKKGRHHLQGALCLKKKGRPLKAIQVLLGHKRTHVEKKKKDSTVEQLFNYCVKDGEERYHEHLIKSELQVRYIRGWKKKRPLALVTYDILNKKQKQIADMFKEPEDPLFGRLIYWFWEAKGNVGKTILGTYFVDNCLCIEVSGKKADMKHGIAAYKDKNGHGPDIVIIDLPRDDLDYVNYGAIEKIKDGKFFSGKYESGMVRYNRPHIICFANSPPHTERMSLDRWRVRNLDW